MVRQARTRAELQSTPGMTCVSRAAAGWPSVPWFVAVARRSLFVAVVGTPACVDPTPTYTAPVQSAPIILGTKVVPQNVQVLPVNLGSPQPLLVPFKSIDAGEGLYAILWLDLNPSASQEDKNKQLLRPLSIREDSRPLDEQVDRAAEFDWQATPAGCHTVTMALSHAQNYPTDPEHGIFEPGHFPPKDPDDIAQITWFFEVQNPNDPGAPPCWSSL